MEPLTVEIAGSEWIEILPLLSLVDPDEMRVVGMVRVVSDGTRRWWWAGDGRRLVRQAGDADQQVYDLLISPRLVTFGARHGGADTTLSVEADPHTGAMTTVLTAVGQRLVVAADRRGYPGIESVFEAEVAASGASVTVDVEELSALVAEARRCPIDPEDLIPPLFWLGVAEGEGLRVSISWEGLGGTRFELQGPAVGSRVAAVPPDQLADALVGLRGEVTVVVPDLAHHAVRVHGEGRDALIMPIKTTFERERVSTEAVLAEVFGRGALERDQDGDYRLGTGNPAVFARLVDDEPVRIQVFAVAVDDVPSSPELFAELNDHNANLGFARCFWMSGQVLVEVDLMAGTTEPAELRAAHERVSRISAELGPMIAAVYGGLAWSEPDPEQRWRQYLAMTVSAELVAGSFTSISGGGPWPYESTVWVLTADDPGGRPRSAEDNLAARAQLVGELYARGAGVQRARGVAADGSYADEGFVVWGLSRGDVLEIGREFAQEAVFEIDEHEVRVVACFEDRVESRPRENVG